LQRQKRLVIEAAILFVETKAAAELGSASWASVNQRCYDLCCAVRIFDELKRWKP
jgi:hypothetical protein